MPIPDQPYTATDVDNAKRTGQLPARAPVAVEEPEEPEDAEEVEEPEEPQGVVEPEEPEAAIEPEAVPVDADVPVEPTAEDSAAEDPVAPAPSTRYADKFPYEHWPQLPWGPEPILGSFNVEEARKVEHAQAWMHTKPLIEDGDETRWHGVRFLGSGSYGAAGLWVQVNSENIIEDVRSYTRTDHHTFTNRYV
jgi:hypothetical protein